MFTSRHHSIALLSALLLTAVAASACSSRTSAEEGPAAKPEPITIATATVESRPIDRFIRVTGSLHERIAIRRLEVLPREVRFHRDRTHVHEWTIEPKDAIHQDRVFVDLLLFDFHEALADGFDVADPLVNVLQYGKQAERRGGFAVVLPRGGNEDPWSFKIH